jgi:hypothetical protein
LTDQHPSWMCRSGTSEFLSNPFQERFLLSGGRDTQPLELVLQAHIGEETRWVFMEVEKGAGTTVEDATALLSESGKCTEFLEERLQLVQGLTASVLHAPDSMTQSCERNTPVVPNKGGRLAGCTGPRAD